MDTARAELVAFKKSSLNNSTDENYKNMLDGMYDYLTRKYDVGKGLYHYYSLYVPLLFTSRFIIVHFTYHYIHFNPL